MKNIISLMLVIALGLSAGALTFKDVPDDHWAADAVYELVKMGVTTGYPDGTFRGNKNITRYETAVLIYKLAKSLNSDEIAKLKADVAALKNGGAGAPISGSYEAKWQTGNLLAQGTRGGVASYRLKLTGERSLDENTNVVVNLDTMDYGFYNANNGDLATELFDVESTLRVNLAELGVAEPIDLKLSFGPGAHQHATDASGVLPSEAGVTYLRPYPGLIASTGLWGMDVSGGYKVLGQNNSGRVTASQITGSMGYNLNGLPLVDRLRLDIGGDYVSSGMFSSQTRDMRGSLAVAAPIGDKVTAAGTLGLGGSDTKRWMVKGEVALNDLWETGTVANIMVSKVGSQFIDPNFAAEEFYFAGFDPFMRPLSNGTVNLAGEVVQDVADGLKIVGKGDVRLSSDYKYDAPSGRLTAQGGLLYALAPNTNVDASYRVFQDKATNDTSDIAAVGLLYQF